MQTADNRYVVETPEIVQLAYEIAGIGSRCMAAVVDTLLLILLWSGLGMLLLFISDQFALEEADSLLLAIWAIFSFLLTWGYYLIFELIWNGQSPGKRMFGLRVVREGGRPITLTVAIIRNLIRVVDFLPLFYGLGALVMFIDPRARRLGDLAAGSLVVRTQRAISLDSLQQQSAQALLPNPIPELLEPILPSIQLLTPEDYETTQEFLRRRAQLAISSRATLAAQLASMLRIKLSIQAEVPPEALIEHVVHAYRLARQPQSEP